MKVQVRLSQSATKARNGVPKTAVPYFAKTSVKVEDEDHESNIPKGEKFYLLESRGKYFLFDVEDDSAYRFEINKTTFDRLSKKHTPQLESDPPKQSSSDRQKFPSRAAFDAAANAYLAKHFKGAELRVMQAQKNLFTYYLAETETHFGTFDAKTKEGWLFPYKKVKSNDKQMREFLEQMPHLKKRK
tara:strand:- start:457 stop:1017 length:561 start_codon:yes stop_codon:yes gene_type:complete